MNKRIPFYRRIEGLGWAARIVIGCLVAWFVLRHFWGIDPIWAMISVVVVSEPEFQSALVAFKSRVMNTLIGCLVGLACLYLLGPAIWSVVLGVGISVLICTNIVRVPGSWKIAPITVLIVMTPGILEHSTSNDFSIGLRRTGQVLFGGLVALTIAYLASRISPQEDGTKPRG
jgi:uncharacterized membrane protein YccC